MYKEPTLRKGWISEYRERCFMANAVGVLWMFSFVRIIHHFSIHGVHRILWNVNLVNGWLQTIVLNWTRQIPFLEQKEDSWWDRNDYWHNYRWWELVAVPWPGLMITREMGGLSICMPSSQISVCEDYRTKECRAERDTIRLENFLSPQGVLESRQWLFTEPSRSVETCTNSGCWWSLSHTRGQLSVALFCVQNWWSTEASGRNI